MATGGRVLHHLAATLPNPKNTVLFVGYQAAGTRGRLLVDGAKEVTHARAATCPVAARIERIDSMSAHADAGEIMRWLSGFARAAVDDLSRARRAGRARGAARADQAERGWPVHVARYLETGRDMIGCRALGRDRERGIADRRSYERHQR